MPFITIENHEPREGRALQFNAIGEDGPEHSTLLAPGQKLSFNLRDEVCITLAEVNQTN